MASTAMRRSLTKALILLIIPMMFLLHQTGSWPSALSHQRTSKLSFGNASSSGNTSVVNLFRHEIQHVNMSSNLVAQSEGKHYGPWTIEPPLPSEITTEEFKIHFQCHWNPEDLCPKRYVVILRGPVLYTPPVEDYKLSSDGSSVSVKIKVPVPGEYEFWAYPDFEQCPAVWREHMKYPWNRGLVMGAPQILRVTGTPTVVDQVRACGIRDLDGSKELEGRWISRKNMLREYRKSEWAQSYNQEQDYIYQPYDCKRNHVNATVLQQTSKITGLLFLGDSVLRGAFCTQVWPTMSKSGLADGECTYANALSYTISKKENTFTNKNGKVVPVAFHFLDDKPLLRLEELVGAHVHSPSHIITNIGLWLAPLSTQEYEEAVGMYLSKLYQLYPHATVIWRTTTDVAPMIQCFGDKGMTREKIWEQREASRRIAKGLKESGMNIYIVDGYDMTKTRPDAGNDGRHWVIESPEEWRWIPRMRPGINQAESAVMDAVWEIVLGTDTLQGGEVDDMF